MFEAIQCLLNTCTYIKYPFFSERPKKMSKNRIALNAPEHWMVPYPTLNEIKILQWQRSQTMISKVCKIKADGIKLQRVERFFSYSNGVVAFASRVVALLLSWLANCRTIISSVVILKCAMDVVLCLLHQFVFFRAVFVSLPDGCFSSFICMHLFCIA